MSNRSTSILQPHQDTSVHALNNIVADDGAAYLVLANDSHHASDKTIDDAPNNPEREQTTWQLLTADSAHGLSQSDDESQDLIIVGQAITLASIQQFLEAGFSGFTSVLVRAHALHLAFSDQAILLSITHPKATDILKVKTINQLSKQFYFDCFLPSKVSLSRPGLLVMDMDSTIINMECIDEIANIAGVGQKVADLTERAMQGELDFNQSLNARVSCLKGIKLEELAKLQSRLPINPGFAKTMATLQSHGWITCIASGGFTYFANYLKDTFMLNEAVSNTLGIIGDSLSGSVEGDIVNGEKKRDVLQAMLRKYDINPAQSIAIGDGANDLLMMDSAALGVAYKAKQKVQDNADANIHFCGFEGLLYCLAQ